MKKLIIILLLFISATLSSLYAQNECPNIDNYSYLPPSIKTNDYVNILFLLDFSASMLEKAFYNNTENENLSGYFSPDVEYCIDTEFTGTTESLLGNLSPGAITAVSDNLTTEQQNQLSSISDNASASRNASSVPDMYIDCRDASAVDLGSIISGLTGAITSLISSGGLCLTADQVSAFLEPFLQLAGAVLSSGGSGLGYQMNAAKMSRNDYVTRILTGGEVQELGRCVSEESNSCLGMGTSEACCGANCTAVDLGIILQLVLTVASGGTTAAASSATTAATSATSALSGSSISLVICLPGLTSEDNCSSYTTEEECTSSQDNCTWIERHAVVLADNNTAVKWNNADSFIEDSGSTDLISQNNNLCNMALDYTINDGGTNNYIYEADNETTGCLEGILQDIQEWDDRYKPRLGGVLYSSAVDESVPLDFDYTSLANAINSAEVESGSTANTDSAVNEAKNMLSADSAMEFNVDGENSAVPCTKNLIFYMSDGLWGETDPIGSFHDIWAGGSADLNTSISGNQNIETYAFNMNLGETEEQTVNSMQNTAIFGGYRDYDNDGWPCGYTALPEDSKSEPIPEPCLEWDSGLDGIPDNYFLYYDPKEYESLIKAIFEMAVEGALEQHYNTTAPAIMRLNEDDMGLWVNAFYFPKLIHEGLSANWRGDVQAYFLDENNSIRENDDNDTDDEDYKLFDFIVDNNTYSDNLITFTSGVLGDNNDNETVEELYSTMVLNYGDTYDNLTPVDCDPYYKALLKSNEDIERTAPVFSALLDNVTVRTERIILLNNNEIDAFTNIDEGLQFDNNTDTRNLLKDIWCLNSDDHIDRIIDQLLNGKNGFYFGDIINSSPVIVPPTSVNNYHNKYNDLSYYDYINSEKVRNRLPIVIVGSNDGMVHAFYTGLPSDDLDTGDNRNTLGLNIKDSNYNREEYEVGQELWAFMPYNVLPYLQWYSAEGIRYHIPKIDYNFTLVDASIGENGNAPPDGELTGDSWRTILVGTMGFGGKKYEAGNRTFSSSIFALDVTNTDPSGNLANGEAGEGEKPQFMWERQLPDNSLALTKPTIIKVVGGESDKNFVNGDWYVVVGSGPNNPQADNFTESPKLYFFNLKNGDLTEVEVNDPEKAISEIMEVDSDNNYSDDTLFFGSYDNETGSLYAVDMSGGNVEDIEQPENIISDDYDAPYFAKPENTFDEYGNIWVYAASGRLFSDKDMQKIDNQTNDELAEQYLLGLKFERNNDEQIMINTISNVYDATNTEVEATVESVSCYCAGVYLGKADNVSGGLTCSNYSCCEGNNEDNNEFGCEMVVDFVENPRINSEGGITVEAFARDSFAADDAQYSGWSISLVDLIDDNYANNENLEYDYGDDSLSYERAYSAPSVFGSLVNFVTYTPIVNPCTVAGTTRLHSLHFMTGTPSGQITFMSGDNILESSTGINIGDTVTMSGSTVVGREGISLPPPTGKSMTSITNKDGTTTTFVGSTRITGQSSENSSSVNSKVIFKKIR
ncbi:MAG: PilC/PilY family type IV pilus protein [Deferribacterota bacterium]|nr:PilC/PilY family type IV pilus protein [Deferribacterota bacterium]